MPGVAQIENPLAAFGLPADGGSVQFVQMRNTSGANITRGDLVIIDTSTPSTTTYPNNVPGKNVVETTTADSPLVLGFANNTAVDGALVDVIISGTCIFANVATGTTAGTLVTSSATAGRAAAKQATAVVGEVIGVVCGATAAANVATVYIFKA